MSMVAKAPIFLSHGSPMLVLESTATTDFLRELGRRIGKPRAVVAVSAHWETVQPMVGAAVAPSTIHDFYGFPERLYQMRYLAPGAPEVAQRIADLLGCETVADRGLDHGVWCPASLMWPQADVPIVPLSIQSRRNPQHHYDIGRALMPLAEEGVLVLASGSLTHNLSAYGRYGVDASIQPWVAAFAEWFAAAAAEGRVEDLLSYRTVAPHAKDNHPTDEHLLPFFTALGASGGDCATPLHRAVEYGVIAMDCYEFKAAS